MPDFEQNTLNAYFSTTWLETKPGMDAYRYTGWNLLEKISKNERVLDVGCGNNEFKPFKNVYGIDPANTRADEVVSIEEFETSDRFDVALCLGSVNFGSRKQIETQIQSISRILEPGGKIYWRCNPGQHDHNNEAFETIPVFPWSFELHRELAGIFGFAVRELKWDLRNRIYSCWQKLD